MSLSWKLRRKMKVKILENKIDRNAVWCLIVVWEEWTKKILGFENSKVPKSGNSRPLSGLLLGLLRWDPNLLLEYLSAWVVTDWVDQLSNNLNIHIPRNVWIQIVTRKAGNWIRNNQNYLISSSWEYKKTLTVFHLEECQGRLM